jgi:hypothetical protein
MSNSCDVLQFFANFLNIVQTDRFLNLIQTNHGRNGRCTQIMFLQMLKHVYWFDSLVAPNFDNVATSSIFFQKHCFIQLC